MTRPPAWLCVVAFWCAIVLLAVASNVLTALAVLLAMTASEAGRRR